MKFNIKNKKNILIVILIVVLIILVFAYGAIFRKYILKRNFAKSNMEIYEKNEEKVFQVEKIILCSSANAIDSSGERNLKNLNIYQYTDLAIYINNGEELSNENTVKELYIDNIDLEGTPNTLGNKSLTYKNLLNFGLKEQITKSRKTENIIFNVVQTNEQDGDANYDDATFYTDCSNPISLEYLNYNLVQDYKMEENNQVAFDGSILEKAGITVDSINCKVKFRINIINNKNEKYSCWINIELPLDDIYEGTTMKQMTTNKNEYVFFKE